jgi:glycosyltransferase involved in cell wall biosynthesis
MATQRSKPVNILVFAPYPSGGLAEYVFHQCKALRQAGVEVTCLAPSSFLQGRAFPGVIKHCLIDAPGVGVLPPLIRQTHFLLRTVYNQWRLAWQLLVEKPDLVLLDTFAEYFAPFWIWPHLFLSQLMHIPYAANLHDPVRNYVLGPRWWHRLSIRMAYWPLSFVLVHALPPPAAAIPSQVRVIEVPHGIYQIRAGSTDRASTRRALKISDQEVVFLMFGAIRDNKNIDLLIRALISHPQVVLVIAGQVSSASQKPMAFYEELAQSLGVASRCRFFTGRVPDADLQAYFAAADFVALTYAASFHSQSGVLNIAAQARRQVLASCSPGAPLQQVVERFKLGVYIAPDSEAAVEAGMERLLNDPPTPEWEGYAAFASWETNAAGILAAAGFIEDDLQKSTSERTVASVWPPA